MQRGSARAAFLVVVTCAALFVWITSRALPEVAASHFGGSGTDNGFMPRDFYVWFMLLVVVGLPVLLVFVPPRLPASWAIGGIVAFVIGCLLWSRVLLGRSSGVSR